MTTQDYLTLDRIEQTLTTVDHITVDDGRWMLELILRLVALPPSSPAPTWFCKGCPETFTDSRIAADHSRATYHPITSNPRERVFVTEADVDVNIIDPSSEAGQRMIRNSAFERPTTQGDPPPCSPVRERPIQQLRHVLSMLCHFVWHRQTRPGDHMWSIPVNKERDFDCILSDAIDELEHRRRENIERNAIAPPVGKNTEAPKP